MNDLELLHRTIQAANLAKKRGFIETHKALLAVAMSLCGSERGPFEVTIVPFGKDRIREDQPN